MTPAQEAVLAVAQRSQSGFCTSHIRRCTTLTQAQAYRVLQQLVRKGMVVPERGGGGFWRPVFTLTGEHHG
jgi:DNA-binding IscR family transcriptional regulator